MIPPIPPINKAPIQERLSTVNKTRLIPKAIFANEVRFCETHKIRALLRFDDLYLEHGFIFLTLEFIRGSDLDRLFANPTG